MPMETQHGIFGNGANSPENDFSKIPPLICIEFASGLVGHEERLAEKQFLLAAVNLA